MQTYNDFFVLNNLYKLYIIISICIISLFFFKIKYLEGIVGDLKKEILINKEKFINNTNNFDKDLIGLSYPIINFEGLQKELFTSNIKQIFSDFLIQLENKLIYLEKEINVTKFISLLYNFI